MMAFEKQEKESEKAFAAFSVYLSQGPERSLAKAAKQLGKSKMVLERWSRRWDWPARVSAYTEHMALIEREAAEALVREKGVDWALRYQELREREWRMREGLLDLAEELLKRWLTSPGRCGTPEGIARLAEVASQLGRRACERAQERTEVSGPEGGPVQVRVEMQAALNKIYGEVVDVQEVRPALPEKGAAQ